MQDTVSGLIMGFLSIVAITIVCLVVALGISAIILIMIPWMRREWRSIKRQIKMEQEAQRRAQLEQEQKAMAKVIQLRNVEIYDRKCQLMKMGSQNGRVLNNKV